MTADPFMSAAIAEAEQSLSEGGIPIGSVIVSGGKIIDAAQSTRPKGQRGAARRDGCARECGATASRRVSRRDAVYDAVAVRHVQWRDSAVRHSPRHHRENQTFRGEEELLSSRGVALEVRQDPSCIRMMTDFIRTHPELWNEDIGVS